MCVKILILKNYDDNGLALPDDYAYSYKGCRLFFRSKLDEYVDKDFDLFIKMIREHNNMDSFVERADVLYQKLGNDNLLFIENYNFGIRWLQSNLDLVDNFDDVIFRGPDFRLKNFIEIKKTQGTPVWDLLLESWEDEIVATSSTIFEELAQNLRNLGINIESSIDGISLQGRRSFGMSPDFRYTPEHLFKKGDKPVGDIIIKMTGSRKLDYNLAFEKAGISASEATEYTWHHLDDFDPDTGTCTMQLVKTDIHNLIKHAGAVHQWELLFLKGIRAAKYAD